MNESEHGKELIDEIRMPIGIYEKLRAQIKRLEVSNNPNDFAFTSDENPSKRIKIENVKIETSERPIPIYRPIISINLADNIGR